MIEVRQIEYEKELLSIGRLRYRIYVQEMGLDMLYANHTEKTLIEPLDSTSTIWGMWHNKLLVGTVRNSFLRKTDIGFYWDLYDLRNLLQNDSYQSDKTSITTRLAVLPQHRDLKTTSQLLFAAYKEGIIEKIQFNIIDCRHRLKPFFFRFGYKEHLKSTEHPEYGEVAILSLDLGACHFLKKI